MHKLVQAVLTCKHQQSTELRVPAIWINGQLQHIPAFYLQIYRSKPDAKGQFGLPGLGNSPSYSHMRVQREQPLNPSFRAWFLTMCLFH